MSRNYIKQLRELLEKTQYSQAEIAEKLGVTHAALNRWLKGHSVPHPRRLTDIEKLFKALVGFPSITEKELKIISAKADAYKIKGLWDIFASNKGLQEEFLLEHTYNSTSIEGTTFTKRETEGVIFNSIIVENKPLKEHLEVMNYAAVLKNVFTKKYSGPITEDFIKHLHENLMQGLHENAGSYSVYERVIRGLDVALTHPKDIPEEMGRLVKIWNKNTKKKTIRDIADFHISFELIHPFGDGNGRLGRIIMALQCLKYGFPPVIIENAKKMEYYDVLQYAQTNFDGPFVSFLLTEMERTSKVLKKYIKGSKTS